MERAAIATGFGLERLVEASAAASTGFGVRAARPLYNESISLPGVFSHRLIGTVPQHELNASFVARQGRSFPPAAGVTSSVTVGVLIACPRASG